MRFQSRYHLKATVFILSVITLSTFIFNLSGNQNLSQKLNSEVYAADFGCPPGMSDAACLAYLENEANKIRAEKDRIESELNAENLAQASLQDKIRYYNNLIAQSNNKISELQLQIETNNVEMRILGNEITDLSDKIDTSSVEINRIKNNLKKRIAVSYKYSSTGGLDILLNTSSIDALSKKLKYLQKSKKRDEELLAGMSEKISLLNQDVQSLNSKIAEVEQKQIENDKQKDEIEAEKNTLASNKTEYDVLFAESKRKEQEYEAVLGTLKAQEAASSALITKFILERFNSGELPANIPVNQGDIIGFQGFTGYSYASHLHFVLFQGGVAVNPFGNGYFTGGGLYENVGSGVAHFPLNGGVLTQTAHGYYPAHQAIDLQSMTSGDQSGNYYYRDYTVACYGLPPITPGYISLRGEGAPIRAIKSGKISEMYTDACGGKYRIVDHGNGETSMYLHMR